MTINPSPTRAIDGVVLPAPGTWEIDPGHTEVSFTGRHFMVSRIRGRFDNVAGTITVAEDMPDSRVDVVIGMASVNSGNHVRDAHLRSEELFDVERFPEATFRSYRVDWQENHGMIHGNLTIHGVTREVALQVWFEAHARDPWGGERAFFSAHTAIDREDFGITWNVALEAGGVLVSKEIDVDIVLEAVLAPPAP